MDPLTKVDNIIRERELSVQGIYKWLPQFLVRYTLYRHLHTSLMHARYHGFKISVKYVDLPALGLT